SRWPASFRLRLGNTRQQFLGFGGYGGLLPAIQIAALVGACHEGDGFAVRPLECLCYRINACFLAGVVACPTSISVPRSVQRKTPPRWWRKSLFLLVGGTRVELVTPAV